VTNWKRMIEIAVDMVVQVINTELSVTPDEPEICEEMWYRSMEDLLPIVEREGLRIEIQSHPWDFCELTDETVDLVPSLRSDHV
ncbi:sugar phosphate isomerase/epimerase IolH, partial [Salmonella enterica subsp. enterica serovar Infantis]